jgi:TP901 family phage tail tape measure protein
MARDKLTVDLELNAAKARREVARLQKEIDKMGKGLSKSFGGGMGGGGDKVRALGTGLSKATVRADEFNKSLEASNARVIAFGASAGLIMAVDRALKAMVSSAIKVEKAMMDINVVMEASTKTLDQFGKGMFKVAKETAQSFDTVSEAAIELARQGLGMEKTLARTKDALILTRLTGMNAADSVKTLTAAVNSFNKEGVTSAQVINRMAKVDAAFAVSSEDLAKSISRVGSSAIDAGVNLNQLMAITTAVQQKTARGGAVIGNAFKTIFTRIQRSDVQKKLRDIGVALTKDGKLLDGVTILENLSRSFGTLSKAQQASVGESVAGVFQINILKAAMSDLVNVNSEYAKSLRIANAATNEAYVRNEQLNQTLDALANKTLANLTQAGAALGGGALEPAIRKILGTVNSAIESFGEGGSMEGVGETVGKGLLAGIGNFVSGPGIILVGAAFTKLALNLGKFATSALKDFMGLANAGKQRVALEEAVIQLIRSEPTYLDAVERGTLDILRVEEKIFAQIELNNLERTKAATYASAITSGLVAKGTSVTSKGRVVVSGKGAFGRGSPGGAGGFIPNFADAGAERAAAAAGGYTAGSIKTMNQPGAGTMMYNSAETVKRFPGMSQSAIMPPQGSPAGAGYKSAFGAAHGFDPYAGGGFIPNFRLGRPPQAEAHKFKRGTEEVYAKGKRGDVVNLDLTLPSKGRDMGIITEEGSDTTPIKFSQNIMSPKSGITELASGMKSWRGNDGRRVGSAMLRVSGIPVVPVFPISKENMSLTGGSSKKPTQPGKYLQKTLNRYSERLSKEMFGTPDIQRDFDVEGLSRGTMGDIFEEGVRVAVGGAKNDDRLASFDYNGKKFASTRLIGFFNRQGRSANLNAKTKIEAKIGAEAAESGNIPRKMINDPDVGYNKKDVMKLFQNEFRTVTGSKGAHLKGTKTKALGFIPNFSALTDAVGREMQAGVPASAIRVGSSSALKAVGNPGGVGVYNTMHEPGGLGQGISRSRASGINPKSHGAASGFVPNYSPLSMGYATEDEIKASREQAKAAKSNVASGKKFKVSADKMMMASMVLNMAASGLAAGTGAGPKVQGGVNAVANIGSMAGMGFAMGGPWGAAGGAALGALSSIGDIGTAFGFDDAKLAAEEMKKVSVELRESFGKLKSAVSVLDDFDSASPKQRIEALRAIVEGVEAIEKGGGGSSSEIVKKLRSNVRADLNIDKILSSGSAKDMPEGGLKGLEDKLATYESQVLAAQGRGEMVDIIGNLAGQGRGLGGVDLTTAALKKLPSFLRSTFSPDIQSSMLGVKTTAEGTTPEERVKAGIEGRYLPSGIDTFKSIRKKSLRSEELMESGPVNEWGESGAVQPQVRKKAERLALSAASDLEKLLRRSNNEGLADELKERIGTANKVERGEYTEGAKVTRRGLLMYMQNIQNDPAMQAFSNPEVVGAAQISANINAGSKYDQGQVSARMREAREGITTAGLDSHYGVLSKMGGRKRHFAGRAVDRASAGRMAGITMAGDALIGEQGRLQKEGAGDKARQAKKLLALKQLDKFTQAELKLRGDLINTIPDITMSYDKQIELLEKFQTEYADVAQDDIELRLKDLDKKQKGADDLTSAEKAEVKYLEGLRKLREADMRETSHGIEEINKSRKSEKDNIDKSTAARISERKAMLEFQRDVRVQAITDAEVKTRNEAAGLRGLQGEGYGITNREIADADKNARRARIRAGGEGDPGAAFKETFAYGDKDALLEFEDGVVDVANTMKSSFASAFQSISSGATTVGGAIANMSKGILDSISQASSQMFTNMLFSRMSGQFSQGGLVPGYASGGIVTGGSGNKDDVLTKMQGGEFVIKKSSAQQIGYGTLNAINSYAGGGGVPQDNSNASMGKMGAIAAGAGAVSGMIGAAMQPGAPKPLPMQDYGMGRGKYGFFGGADPDAGQTDSLRGGRGRAEVSLGKSFSYYRRDSDSGDLISEKARPTEGRFEVSSRLSLLGRLGEDPQTGRMFGKEQKMASYQQYLADETKSRADQIQAVEDQKKARRIQAGVNAVMMIGGAYAMDKMQAAKLADQQRYAALNAKDTGGPGFVPPDMAGYGGDGYPAGTTNYRKSAYERIGTRGLGQNNYNNYYPGGFPASAAPSPASMNTWMGGGGSRPGLSYGQDSQTGSRGIPGFTRQTDDSWLWPGGSTISVGGGGGGANGGLARVMGGEYVMSPEAVRTYGTDFMTELNRGNAPGFANGGPVGFSNGGPVGGATVGGGGGIGTTNNVRINVNIDKRGAAEASADSKSEDPTAQGQQSEDNNEVLNNKEFAGVLEGVVLEQIIKQQRPGGLLSAN